jgi:hypothetical protein
MTRMARVVEAKVGTCWWCGNTADSREHRFKRTDIEREFGPGPYRDGRTLVKHGDDKRQTDVTGAKSKVFKFEKTICSRCNGHRSQLFDTAYTQFMDYLFDSEDIVLTVGEVDHRNIFGAHWESMRLDLARYFVKHICCRLANLADRRAAPIDTRLIEFLNAGDYPICLGLAPLIDMSVAEFLRLMRLFEEQPGDYGSFLYLAGVGGIDSPRPEPIEHPEGGMLVGWFGIYWRIAEDEYIPNQLAGPCVPPVITDWIFGTDNRLVFSRLACEIKSGNVDPKSETLGELLDEFGFDRSRSLIDSGEGPIRPEPSPLGIAGN